MNRPASQLPKIFLKPGELHFSVHPTIVATVLGSCVSVTMCCPARGIGAICHALLPEESTSGDPGRYVDSAVRALLEHYSRHGISSCEIEVKLFGGADVLPTGGIDRCDRSVGSQNVDAALRIIAEKQLLLRASDVGGSSGRRLLFNSSTGEVLMKRLRTMERY